ncbi:MAG: hemolysin family protein [Bifidobacterium sp.]|uniref:Hemolysin family protein n=1 Tax=Bifidobacterium fermentum TaxID=3059035 RepID=A0AB39UE63_9BIFI
MNVDSIVVIVLMAAVAVVFIWVSLVMAATEGAMSRVTRASLNNLMLEIQTDSELGQFSRMKRIDRVQRVQRLLSDRFATAGACAFFRVMCNVLDGLLIAVIMRVLDAPLWSQLVSGVVAALIIATLSVLLRPRVAGAKKPLDIMLKHATITTIASLVTPFSHANGFAQGKRRNRDLTLSDEEELDKIQLEQGRAMIDRMVEANDFDPEVSEMLRNVLMLSDTLTREIMVPRTDMICIEQDATLGMAMKLFSRSGFSRIPVIGEDVDDLVGMAYLKDVVRAVAFNPAAESRDIASICRTPMLVPESKAVDDLFHHMQQTRQHIAVVIDEYGGIAGLVTIEDAIEQIVGELEDEHDRTQHSQPEQIDEHAWKLPARTPIADLEELFEIDIDEDDVDTVYGLLTKILGRVPIVGATAVTMGLRLTAVDSAGRRKKVSTILVEPATEPSHADRANADGSDDADGADSADGADASSQTRQAISPTDDSHDEEQNHARRSDDGAADE